MWVIFFYFFFVNFWFCKIVCIFVPTNNKDMNFYIEQSPPRIGFRQSNSDSVSVVDKTTIRINCGAFIPDALGLAMRKAEELGWKDWTWKAAKKVLVRTAIIVVSLSAPALASGQADRPDPSRFVGYSMYGDSLFTKCACPPKAIATDTIKAQEPKSQRPAHWPKREPLLTPIRNERKDNTVY